MVQFNIEVTSDVACPWCYIGHQNIHKAIETFQQQQQQGYGGHGSSSTGSTNTSSFTIKWLPYYINPSAPPYPGADRSEFYSRKFGISKERFAGINTRVASLGKEAGIDFKFGGVVGSTKDAHRLVYLVGAKVGSGAQEKVVKELFRVYHEEEANVTDLGVLVSVAETCGLDGKVVRGWLESDEGSEEVDVEVKEAIRGGVTGVPSFRVNGLRMEGARGVGEFLEVFERVVKDEKRKRT